MSYVVDVYRGDGKAQRNACGMSCCTLRFFPQLIAGPIVRYSDFADQIHTADTESSAWLE